MLFLGLFPEDWRFNFGAVLCSRDAVRPHKWFEVSSSMLKSTKNVKVQDRKSVV